MKKYEAMVLSCIDPRFQAKVFNYLKRKKLTGKFSAFTIAGAAIGVTHKKFKKWHSTFWDNRVLSVLKIFSLNTFNYNIASLRITQSNIFNRFVFI